VKPSSEQGRGLLPARRTAVQGKHDVAVIGSGQHSGVGIDLACSRPWYDWYDTALLADAVVLVRKRKNL
jgi:hypothetical protein